MVFEEYVIRRAFQRQGGRCAVCGKKLSWHNRGKDDRWGAWKTHPKKPSAYGGNSYLSNCVLLCINRQNCHLYVGHSGVIGKSFMLSDRDLSYLYVRE